MIVPRLLICFADFPCPPCAWRRAAHPRALMRSVRPAAVLFSVQRPRIVAPRSPRPRREGSPGPPLQSHSASPHTLPPGECPRRALSGAGSLALRNPSLRPMHVATTSRICTARPSTHACAHASPGRARQPTAHRAAGIARQTPSIFGRRAFGGCVATRSLADADLHGHRPAVPMRARPFRPAAAA